MPHGEVSVVIPAPCQAVFDLIHDYARRLEWDTLLQAAYLDNGSAAAGQGVTSVCIGRRSLGGIALKTVYVTFQRPTLAAVKMVNSPPFFRTWAASIHHEPLSAAESRITYKFHFTTRPAVLRFILDPLMQRVFLWETRKRLQALKDFLSREHACAGSRAAGTHAAVMATPAANGCPRG
jgi:hypothetical protein